MQTQPRTLIHNLISLPDGRTPDDDVAERHDIVLLFDATKANPNGDPDTGNMPRMQPDTLRGLVTDVCLKRKIRNFFLLYNPDGTLRSDPPAKDYEIFIRENAILQELMESPQIKQIAKSISVNRFGLSEDQWDGKSARGKKGKQQNVSVTSDEQATETNSGLSSVGETKSVSEIDVEDARRRAYRDALCQSYFDIRAFGGVTSTDGPLKGSFYGQIRGPLQFSFAESLDRVLQLDATITRCAVASKKEKKENDDSAPDESGNRTMGRKHIVDYGLYRTHIYFSPAFGAKTHFTYYDLDNFFFALIHMFRDDNAASRTGLRVVGLVDFQHASALGNEHAHKLFELVKVQRTPESRKRGDYPRCDEYADCQDPLHANYCGDAPDGPVRQVEENGQSLIRVTARKLVWEIPACQK